MSPECLDMVIALSNAAPASVTSGLDRRRAAKLIQNVIAQHRQWPRKSTVKHLHRRQQMRPLRNPWFGCARWDSHANADPLFQHKPRSESSYQLGTAVIKNL